MKVRRYPRMKLLNTDLQISKIGVHDGGMYRCEIEQDVNQPLAVVHTVEILGEKQHDTSNRRPDKEDVFPMICLIMIIISSTGIILTVPIQFSKFS